MSTDFKNGQFHNINLQIKLISEEIFHKIDVVENFRRSKNIGQKLTFEQNWTLTVFKILSSFIYGTLVYSSILEGTHAVTSLSSV